MSESFDFEVGRLFCGTVRDFLHTEKLRGRQIQWHEGSGWLSRRFTVAGASADVAFIASNVRSWINQLGAQDARKERK